MRAGSWTIVLPGDPPTGAVFLNALLRSNGSLLNSGAVLDLGTPNFGWRPSLYSFARLDPRRRWLRAGDLPAGYSLGVNFFFRDAKISSPCFDSDVVLIAGVLSARQDLGFAIFRAPIDDVDASEVVFRTN